MTALMRNRTPPHGHISPQEVGEIWRGLDENLNFTDGDNAFIANQANYWNANVRCIALDKGRNSAGKAHKVLSEWCLERRANTIESVTSLSSGLSDEEKENLEKQALKQIEDVLLLKDVLDRLTLWIKPLPPQEAPWTMIAQHVWLAAGANLEQKGRTVGVRASALAVVFTTRVLEKLGYPTTAQNATPAAVSGVVRKLARKLKRGDHDRAC